jgi:hypothetical protein
MDVSKETPPWMPRGLREVLTISRPEFNSSAYSSGASVTQIPS